MRTDYRQRELTYRLSLPQDVFMQAELHPLLARFGDVVLDRKRYGLDERLPGLTSGHVHRLIYRSGKERQTGIMGKNQVSRAQSLFSELQQRAFLDIQKQGYMRIGHIPGYGNHGWLYIYDQDWAEHIHPHTDQEIEQWLKMLQDNSLDEREHLLAGKLLHMKNVLSSYYFALSEYGRASDVMQIIHEHANPERALLGQYLLYAGPMCLSSWCPLHNERYTVGERYFMEMDATRRFIEYGRPK